MPLLPIKPWFPGGKATSGSHASPTFLGTGLRGAARERLRFPLRTLSASCTRGCCFGTVTARPAEACSGQVLMQCLPVGTHVCSALRFGSLLPHPAPANTRVPASPCRPPGSMCSP